MSQQRAWGLALLAAGSLLLLPAVGSAQMATRNFMYYPSYYSYGYFPYNWGYTLPNNVYSYWPYTYGSPGLSAPAYAVVPATSSGSDATPDYYSGSTLTNGYGVGTGSTRTDYTYGADFGSSRSGPVHVNVRLPDANAKVWVQGQPTQQSGTWREFVSPPLDPSRNYRYEIRARWVENGRDRDETRTIPVQANGVETIDFTRPDNHSRVDELNGAGTPRHNIPPPALGGAQPSTPRSGDKAAPKTPSGSSGSKPPYPR
jgi:uncharacterized protein (TIGR03000 family)